MKIIKERERVTDITLALDFYKDGEICAGYDSKDGKTPVFQSPEGENNWYDLLKRVESGELTGPIVNKYKHSYISPAIGKCDCGYEVELVNQYMGACECEHCGRWYNLFGQELLPPDRWEENFYE